MNGKGLQMHERITVEPGKEWIQNSFILIERFCNEVSKENVVMNRFLNRYFNDEGYVDVWRIPYLLTDIYDKNYAFHTGTLHLEEFRKYFKSFLILYYNYYVETNTAAIHDYETGAGTYQAIRAKQSRMNAFMDAFGRIMHNLEAYQGG